MKYILLFLLTVSVYADIIPVDSGTTITSIKQNELISQINLLLNKEVVVKQESVIFSGFIGIRTGVWSKGVQLRNKDETDESLIIETSSDSTDGTIIKAKEDCRFSIKMGVRGNGGMAIAEIGKFDVNGLYVKSYRVDSDSGALTNGRGVDLIMLQGESIMMGVNQVIMDDYTTTYLSVTATSLTKIKVKDLE